MAVTKNWKSIILNLFSWLTLINWPTSTTKLHEPPSGEGIGPADIPQCYHQSRMKTKGTGPAEVPLCYHQSQMRAASANRVTITLVFAAYICNGEQLSTHHCPTLRSNTKVVFYEPYHEQVAFNLPPCKAICSQNQVDTQEVPTSSAGFQTWSFLI